MQVFLRRWVSPPDPHFASPRSPSIDRRGPTAASHARAALSQGLEDFDWRSLAGAREQDRSPLGAIPSWDAQGAGHPSRRSSGGHVRSGILRRLVTRPVHRVPGRVHDGERRRRHIREREDRPRAGAALAARLHEDAVGLRVQLAGWAEERSLMKTGCASAGASSPREVTTPRGEERPELDREGRTTTGCRASRRPRPSPRRARRRCFRHGRSPAPLGPGRTRLFHQGAVGLPM
jgi:hypothetical protein